MTNLNKTATHAREIMTSAIAQSKASDAVNAVKAALANSDACVTHYGTALRLDDDALRMLVSSREIAKRAKGAALGRPDRFLAAFLDHAAAHADRDQYSLPQCMTIGHHATTTQAYYMRLFLMAVGALTGRIPAVEDRAAGFTIDRDSKAWQWLMSL